MNITKIYTCSKFWVFFFFLLWWSDLTCAVHLHGVDYTCYYYYYYYCYYYYYYCYYYFQIIVLKSYIPSPSQTHTSGCWLDICFQSGWGFLGKLKCTAYNNNAIRKIKKTHTHTRTNTFLRYKRIDVLLPELNTWWRHFPSVDFWRSSCTPFSL